MPSTSPSFFGPPSWFIPPPDVKKLKGLAIGTLALRSRNIVRIITLFYLGQFNRAWFDFAHFYLWESLVIDTLAIFWAWDILVRRRVLSSSSS